VTNALDAPAIDRTLYLERYPDLTRLADDHDVNALRRNLACAAASSSPRPAPRGPDRQRRPHQHHAFAQTDRGLFPRLPSPTLWPSSAWRHPVHEIGLYRDAYRPNCPNANRGDARHGTRLRTRH